MSNKLSKSNIPTARLMLYAFRAFESELATLLQDHGFTDVSSGNFNLMRHLNPEGMRLTDLAKDAGISKQAIGKMAGELKEKGYLDILPDDDDGRAKFVQFSSKGEALIAFAVKEVEKMEAYYQQMLGERNYTVLRMSLEKILSWHSKDQRN